MQKKACFSFHFQDAELELVSLGFVQELRQSQGYSQLKVACVERAIFCRCHANHLHHASLHGTHMAKLWRFTLCRKHLVTFLSGLPRQVRCLRQFVPQSVVSVAKTNKNEHYVTSPPTSGEIILTDNVFF